MDEVNQRPPNLTRQELPGWAEAALQAFQRAWAAQEGARYPGDSRRWQGPKPPTAFWPTGRPPRVPGKRVRVALGLMAVGAPLLVVATLGLRWGSTLSWAFGVGGALVFAGALLYALQARRHAAQFVNGLLLTHDGLLVIDGEHYRAVSRRDVREIVLERGELVVVYGPDARRWRQYSATPGSSAHAVLERRQRELQGWLEHGGVSAPALHSKRGSWEFHTVTSFATWIGGVGALLGFLWLTLVMPAQSDAAAVAGAFIRHLEAGELDSAYDLLSEERQAAFPRAGFESAVPAALRNSKGFKVNGISGSVGAGRQCVHGWLDDGSSYAFRVVPHRAGESLRIDGWRNGSCKRW